MKPRIERKNLASKNDIWNAVISVVSEADFQTPDPVLREAFILFQYYSELESGGHEALLNWASSSIEEIGIDRYVLELIAYLENIGAHDYAIIEEKYGHKLWNLYMAVENDSSKIEEFLIVIKEADDEYWKLEGKLEQLLETYFIEIHPELFEIIDD